MNNDSYKIVISLSHRHISYEYWLRDGEDKLLPMPGGNWPAPLAFYCSQKGIIIGTDAEGAAHSGTANAFDRYFERLREGGTYQYGGQSKQIGNLLLDATETVFRDFYSNILFNRYGSIAENRANMPLLIACETDIEPNEKAYLTSLFKDSGYGRMRVVDYETYIEQYINESLSKDFSYDNVLVAWSEGFDLRFTLFQTTPKAQKQHLLLNGLGIDPRLDYVKNLIWTDIAGQNPWLNYETEMAAIETAAVEFLNSNQPLVSQSLTMSDGHNYKYRLERTRVDYIPNEESVTIKKQLEQFLKNTGIGDRSKTLLLFRGSVAGNSYFEQILSPGFLGKIRSDDKLRGRTMKFLLDEQIPITLESVHIDTPEQKKDVPSNTKVRELHKKWRQVKADATGKDRATTISILSNFLSECESSVGVDELIDEVKNAINSIMPTCDSNQVKALERKWREIKATAKAKIRTSNYSEARLLLANFIEECKAIPGTDELIKSVRAEYNLIPSGEAAHPKLNIPEAQTATKHKVGDKHPSKPWVWTEYAPGKFDWRCIKEPIHKVGDKHPSKPWVWTEYAPGKFDWRNDKDALKEHQSEDQGRSLIAQNKIKEARDWYREKGDSQKARLLSDIIRDQKGLELRKKGLEEYRKTKNKDQIGRIIKELEEYLDLCNKVGLQASEYVDLLMEYRKIK